MFEIRSVKDFKKLEELVNDDIDTNIDVKLGNDIVFFNNVPRIGTDDLPYMGCFDGCGHTIRFENCHCPNGLFTHIGYGAVLKNTNFEGTVIDGPPINRLSYGRVENCNTDLELHLSPGWFGRLGGIINAAKHGVIENCECHNKLILEEESKKRSNYNITALGGIVGSLEVSEINSCTNCTDFIHTNDNIVVNAEKIAGICGEAKRSIIKNCVNKGNIKVEGKPYIEHINTIGGILGYVQSGYPHPNNKYRIENCENEGNIEIAVHRDPRSHQRQIYIGGIIGQTQKDPNIIPAINCKNPGHIISDSYRVNYIGYDPSKVSYFGNNDAAHYAFQSGDFDICKEFINKIKDPTIINDNGENLLHSLCSCVDLYKYNPTAFISLVMSLAEHDVDFSYKNPNNPQDPLSYFYDSGNTKRVLRGFKNVITAIQTVAKTQQEQQKSYEDFSDIGW